MFSAVYLISVFSGSSSETVIYCIFSAVASSSVMSSPAQPLITTQHIHYASTDKTENQQGSLPNSTLTEAPHSVTQLNDMSQGDNTTHEEFIIVDNDEPMAAIVKKTDCILKPYMIFLNIIGWRKIDLPFCIISRPCPRRACSIFHFLMILFLIFLLLVSCVTQILLCFDRVLVLIPENAHLDGVYHIKCSKHIVSKFIIQDMLLLFAFCYCLYIFLIKQPEDLSTLAQKVFFAVKGRLSKKLTISLQMSLVLFIMWIFFCVGINILQVFANHMKNKEVDFEFIGNITLPWKITLMTITLFGLFVFDVAFAAVVINYAMQCQLMVYWFKGIFTRTLTKPTNWKIEDAIKEMNDAHIFLKKINGHLSRAMGIMMFIFLYSSVLSFYGIRVLNGDHDEIVLHAIAGFLTLVRWTLLLFVPLIQAARVTRFGSKIKETAIMIRARPFQHQDTPQLDLDSFVTYCSNIELKAKLISVPISPLLVVSGAFIFGLAFFIFLRFDEFSWATWL